MLSGLLSSFCEPQFLFKSVAQGFTGVWEILSVRKTAKGDHNLLQISQVRIVDYVSEILSNDRS